MTTPTLNRFMISDYETPRPHMKDPTWVKTLQQDKNILNPAWACTGAIEKSDDKAIIHMHNEL